MHRPRADRHGREHGRDRRRRELDDRRAGDRPALLRSFHYEWNEVGYRNIDPEIFYSWSELEIRADHTATFRLRFCGEPASATNEWTWTYDEAARSLRLLPNAGDRVELGVCDAAAVEFTLGEDCDELWMHVVGPSCSSKPESRTRYLPGRVCPEVFEGEGRTPMYGDTCFFEFVWCDERPQPACQAP